MIRGVAIILLLARTAVAGPDTSSSRSLEIAAEITDLRRQIAETRANRRRTDDDAARRAEIESLIADVLEDASTRTSFQGGAWNELASADGAFTLRLDAYLQVEWALNHSDDTVASGAGTADTLWGFSIVNTRVTFSGTVGDPSWRYVVRLQMGADGTGDDEFAYIQKKLEQGWFFEAGLVCPMFSLEQAISTTETLGSSLSFIAGQFDPENAEGIVLGRRGDQLRGAVTLCNGWSTGSIDWNGNQRTGVIARSEWKPYGDWNDLYLFNPYPDRVQDGMLLGVGGAYSWGEGVAIDGDQTEVTADLSFQSPGVGFSSSINWQHWDSDQPLGGRRLAAMMQAAVMPTPNWSIYLRGEWGSILDGDQPDFFGATLGTSWFPSGDASVKLTVEVLGFLGDTSRWRQDGDVAVLQVDGDQFAIRAQMQLSL